MGEDSHESAKPLNQLVTLRALRFKFELSTETRPEKVLFTFWETFFGSLLIRFIVDSKR